MALYSSRWQTYMCILEIGCVGLKHLINLKKEFNYFRKLYNPLNKLPSHLIPTGALQPLTLFRQTVLMTERYLTAIFRADMPNRQMMCLRV
ncbi:hypothetical protein BRADI_5g13971v3 [Brachypodium distachyon]|uniref:Uncharacterized protein n=1 Tax=Brachypodium distachyon TaxID=15368 RepID=A0A2K2CH33_BRADI|nr:hypothetical protein BRADI_5g13971v3 [Brachypodium distachyon]